MTDTALGPMSYLIVEFPGSKMTGDGFAALLDLVDRGLVRIVDLEFVTRGKDGSIAAISLQELDSGDFDLTVFAGASSGLLDQSDLDELVDALEPGSSAVVLLYENRWAADFVAGVRRGGGEVIAAGYIPLDVIEAALDATEPA
jgi:hypothetical protein